MKSEDIADYFKLRKTIQNPWAFIRLRKHPRPDRLFEVRFRDGRVFLLRSGGRDRHVFHRLFLKDEYGIHDANLGNLECVIDIGGHIGTFSFLVAPKARRVLVFEPISENFELLRRNLSAPQFGHVSCVKAAITDMRKEVKIYKSSSPGSHSAFRIFSTEGSFEVVPGLSLEDVLRDYGVERCDLLKVDCEGAEYEILYSACEDVISRVSRIVLEYHDIASDNKSWNAGSLRNYLQEKGFTVRTKPRKRHDKQGIMYCHR